MGIGGLDFVDSPASNGHLLGGFDFGLKQTVPLIGTQLFALAREGYGMRT